MAGQYDKFGFEIDFLPVGDSTKNGDAICLRWGYNLSEENTRRQWVMVVDGGFADSGEDVVRHVEKYYETKQIDVLVNTHPHADHLNGLEKIVEACTVKYLVMHRPWEHGGLKEAFNDGRVTSKSIRESLKEGLEKAYRIAVSAKNKGAKLSECFTPSKWENLCGVDVYVLSPSKKYYESLLPSFNVTPTVRDYDGTKRVEFSDKLYPEAWYPLTDEGETSAENNSGIVLALKLPEDVGGIVMLTGDAGIPAIENAIVEATRCRLDLKNDIAFFQVPHHGSIQNLGPTILNKIFGKPLDAAKRVKTAYVSVSKGHDNQHPAKHVINALEDRGVECYMTNGQVIRKSFGKVPERPGWVALSKIARYAQVEAIYVPYS